jgi:hypothetical protein
LVLVAVEPLRLELMALTLYLVLSHPQVAVMVDSVVVHFNQVAQVVLVAVVEQMEP